MAPKKASIADKDKDATEKPDDAKPADDKGEKKTLKEKLKDFVQSTTALYIATVITVIFVASAIICSFICVRQWNKTADLRNAMYLIRKFMISKDASYEKKGDIETIFDADQLTGDLAVLALMLNELEEEIIDIRYRLSHDWMAKKNILYHFAKQGSTFWEAKEFCENDKAKIAKIESAAEMEFIEKLVVDSFNTYWLGAIKESNKWIWAVDNTEVTTTYWMEGKPTTSGVPPKGSPVCLTHQKYCKNKRKCWMDEPCSERRRIICRKKPLKKWMT